MKFGKRTDLANVDFSLPPDHPSNAPWLAQQPQEATPTPTVYIGCTGWSMKEWVGSVYPTGTKSGDYLKYYSQQFNTIELNTTHYRIPDTDTLWKWKHTVPADFRFCPKVPQSISHTRHLGAPQSLIDHFCDQIAQLDTLLGHCFMQLPPYFGHDQLPDLLRFLDRFPTHIPLAIEVRHESWFESPAALQDLADASRTRHIVLLMTDVAGRRDVLHPYLTDCVAMVRFVGNGLHTTDYERLDAWVQRIQQWVAQGVHTIYFFPHEPDNLHAPEAADYFHQQLRRHLPGLRTRGPRLSTGPAPEQMSLF